MRLLLFAALGFVFYFALRRLAPNKSITLQQYLMAAGVVLAVFVYLRSPIDLIPDGTAIGFLDDLLIATGAYVWLRRRLGVGQPEQPREESKQNREPGGPAPHADWDPYAVLGLSRGATQEEISRAYRAQMKRYHPDRVDGLGEELQRVAHEKTLEIQRAYEELGGKRSSS